VYPDLVAENAALRADNARLGADLDLAEAAVHDLAEDQSGAVVAAAARGEVLALLERDAAADRATRLGGDDARLPGRAAERALTRAIALVYALGPARDPLPPQRLRARVAELEEAVRDVLATVNLLPLESQAAPDSHYLSAGVGALRRAQGVLEKGGPGVRGQTG
jgi:hypothetical protein